MDKTEMLHELCRALTEELETVSEKIHKAGGMSAGDLDTTDKLSHALKCVKTVLAMTEAEDDYSYDGGGSSNRGGRSYDAGRSYEDRSYARGRGRGAKRDSMGRYSREAGYSYAEDMDEIREMIRVLPEEKRRMLMNEMG